MTAVSHSSVGKAIGVEIEREEYDLARKNAINRLAKSQLKIIDFWFARYDSDEDDGYGNSLYDYGDATIVYNSLIEEENEIQFYKDRFNTKRLRLIKKDLPLVSYEPDCVNRDNNDCWFFLHKFPLKNKKLKSKDNWARSVLGTTDAKIDDVFRYYRRQWGKRVSRNEVSEKSSHLKKLVCFRF
jgi:hypothetical protein